MLFQYPYPRQLRHWLIGLFAVAMATLATGLLALIAKLSGVDISEADMLRWLIPSFGISFLALGALLVSISFGIRQVNSDRDGRHRKFITPTKHGISESEKPLEYQLYATFLFALGIAFALISTLFLKIWIS